MKRSLLFGVCVLTLYGASAEMLWEIGTPDNSGKEFALAPGGYRGFTEDGYFGVGHSDAQRDWPYVHPGPADAWAGGRPHTFTIVFAVADVPADGKCVLRFDAVDTHGGAPPRLRIEVNGKAFRRELPQGAGNDRSIEGDTAQGREHAFWVAFPVDVLKAGENEVTITNESGSWFLYDWIGLEAPDSVQLAAMAVSKTRVGEPSCPPVLVKQNGALAQPIRVPVRYFGDDTVATVRISGHAPVELALSAGTQTAETRVPAVSQETPVTITVEVNGAVVSEREAVLKPVRPWVVYLLHHTHLDIGYTHLQADVEAVQWRHIEQALTLAEQTADYPTGARFKWLPEGLWAVDSYLGQASPGQRRRFVDAVRKGWIGLDALYGNELTALCRPEELLELTGYARRLSKDIEVPIDSAMITDVPGYTWGIVPALALSGVKYLSIGPNAGHRIGYTLETWGDKPFYWVSPSGKDKVLCWVAGKAYSWFHRGPIREEQGMLDYLAALDASGYPYDYVQVRYNIGGDNGPPDPALPDFVKDWNNRYAYPRLVIATTSEMFRDFETRYGGVVPEVRGDFTPYWEDGAASSARETCINRDAAERLVQAQALWAMLRPGEYPAEAFHAAWREIILYDEHTWGAHNSISAPESEFALGQWAVKQAFALEGERQSYGLLRQALEGRTAKTDTMDTLLVFNTSSWPRTDLVLVPATWNRPGDRVTGPGGAPIPSQRMSNGQLAFMARDVPPMGARRFTLQAGDAFAEGAAAVHGVTLSDGRLQVTVDEATGAIASLTCEGIASDLVARRGGLGLNDYFYVAGRDPKDPQRNGPVTIRVKESGPLVASVVVESDAPGCRHLTREIRVVAGLDRVDIINVIDKEKIYDQEAVHLAYPFGVPDGVVRMDIPWAVARPETDQLLGACKNYFTVQRWVDVSNAGFGVTWATVDAPLVEVGAITNDPRVVGWIKQLEPTTVLFSYVMNNYWETNYKAAQEGPTTFRFSLRPHGAYDQAAAQRFGIERSQPLVLVSADAAAEAPAPMLRVEPDGVVVTAFKPSDDGKAWIVRLFNATESKQDAAVQWPARAPSGVWVSNLNETPDTKLSGAVEMAPGEIVTLRAALPET